MGRPQGDQRSNRSSGKEEGEFHANPSEESEAIIIIATKAVQRESCQPRNRDDDYSSSSAADPLGLNL
jgi:hypothetical protein